MDRISEGAVMEGISEFFKSAGRYFSDFGHAIVSGDWAVRLSLVIMGAGYFKRHQIIRGIIMTVIEAVVIIYAVVIGVPYLSKFGTLGTVQREQVFNLNTMKNEFNDYDNSFLILLFGIISIVILTAAVFFYIRNIKEVYRLQKLEEAGKHINSFRDDIKELRNQKFYITLLTLPVLGIIVFTVIPLIVMIFVAFTDYDQNHMPPAALFTWVGLDNFKAMFSTELTTTFAYSFRTVIVWTIVWAFFATFTCYFGGIFLSLLINNKNTKWPKFWRTLFVITIAVPQFVSLLLVRNFFANTGIVNTVCANTGVTAFLKSIWLVRSGLTYIPFLSSPGWAKVMIILINIWVGVPYLMLIATGVLMNIPTDLSEAARIDGASKIQIFNNITMPYMLFVTGPYLVTSFVANINNFNIIYLLTQDVYNTTDQKLANSSAKEVDLLVTWLYRLTQDKYNYKMASVIGILVFIICSALTLIAFNSLIKGDREEEFR